MNEAENVVMVRTFSKMGIAGERVGWMYGPAHVVDAVNRLRGPFNVSLSGQAAATAAARGHRVYGKTSRAQCAMAGVADAGAAVERRAGAAEPRQFHPVRCSGCQDARAIDGALLDKGWLVRETPAMASATPCASRSGSRRQTGSGRRARGFRRAGSARPCFEHSR